MLASVCIVTYNTIYQSDRQAFLDISRLSAAREQSARSNQRCGIGTAAPLTRCDGDGGAQAWAQAAEQRGARHRTQGASAARRAKHGRRCAGRRTKRAHVRRRAATSAAAALAAAGGAFRGGHTKKQEQQQPERDPCSQQRRRGPGYRCTYSRSFGRPPRRRFARCRPIG